MSRHATEREAISDDQVLFCEFSSGTESSHVAEMIALLKNLPERLASLEDYHDLEGKGRMLRKSITRQGIQDLLTDATRPRNMEPRIGADSFLSRLKDRQEWRWFCSDDGELRTRIAYVGLKVLRVLHDPENRAEIVTREEIDLVLIRSVRAACLDTLRVRGAGPFALNAI